MLKHVNLENFESEVLESKKLILIDFFATWCGPCQMLGPVLEEISKKRNDFDVIKIDIDLNKDLAYKYEIEVVPTMVILKDGQEMERKEGFYDEKDILEMIEKYL